MRGHVELDAFGGDAEQHHSWIAGVGWSVLMLHLLHGWGFMVNGSRFRLYEED